MTASTAPGHATSCRDDQGSAASTGRHRFLRSVAVASATSLARRDVRRPFPSARFRSFEERRPDWSTVRASAVPAQQTERRRDRPALGQVASDPRSARRMACRRQTLIPPPLLPQRRPLPVRVLGSLPAGKVVLVVVQDGASAGLWTAVPRSHDSGHRCGDLVSVPRSGFGWKVLWLPVRDRAAGLG